MSRCSAEHEQDKLLPSSVLNEYPEIQFRDVSDISKEALEMSRSSPLHHAFASPSSWSFQGEAHHVRSMQMSHGHDVLVRRALWEEEKIRPAVDVAGFRRLEKKTKNHWGCSRVRWVQQVSENIEMLRREVYKRYGKQYHHSDLDGLFNLKMLETVALAAAIRGKNPKLPYICVRQALGPPFTEKQQELMHNSQQGCVVVGNAKAEVWRGRKRLAIERRMQKELKEGLPRDCFGLLMDVSKVDITQSKDNEGETVTTTASKGGDAVEEADDDVLAF